MSRGIWGRRRRSGAPAGRRHRPGRAKRAGTPKKGEHLGMPRPRRMVRSRSWCGPTADPTADPAARPCPLRRRHTAASDRQACPGTCSLGQRVNRSFHGTHPRTRRTSLQGPGQGSRGGAPTPTPRRGQGGAAQERGSQGGSGRGRAEESAFSRAPRAVGPSVRPSVRPSTAHSGPGGAQQVQVRECGRCEPGRYRWEPGRCRCKRAAGAAESSGRCRCERGRLPPLPLARP